MKGHTNSISSEDYSMSVKSFSSKLRFFTLVVNTADLINERATPTLGISHALIAPVAIFTTYFFIGIFVIGACRNRYASWFLQVYGLVCSCAVEMALSFIVFSELKESKATEKHGSLALDGVLPMINTVLLLLDLTMFVLSGREEIAPAPARSVSTSRSSQTDI